MVDDTRTAIERLNTGLNPNIYSTLLGGFRCCGAIASFASIQHSEGQQESTESNRDREEASRANIPEAFLMSFYVMCGYGGTMSYGRTNL